MANQVTDNRTLIADGTVANPGGSGLWEDIGGTVAVVDTEITYDTYSGSIGEFSTDSRAGTFWNAEAIGLFSSGDHAYLLINSGVVGLLETKALGGLTVRVTGATATDWAEFELFGSDEWPAAFGGGWSQIVIDIDELLANPTNTNGTPPTVGNIQRFGVTFLTTIKPRMADNFWVGGFAILPANTPAIIIEGRDGGSTDWNFASVSAVAAVQLSAVLLPGPGGSFVCRGPIQFGISDSSTHAFSDTNKTLLFDSQEVMLDGFYGLSALGNSGGTTDVDLGLKSGSGASATGAQGGVIQADSAFNRWFIDFDDPDLDSINFFGVSMLYGSNFQMDDVAVEVISSLFIDVTTVEASNSDAFLRNGYINPNTAANNSALIWNENVDVDGILDGSTFEKGTNTHHAIEFGLDIPTSSITLRGCAFGTVFSATEDGSVGDETFHFLDTTGTITLNLIGCTGNFGYRTEGVVVTIVADPVTTLVNVRDNLGANLQNARVLLETSSGAGDLPFEDVVTITRSGATATVSHTAHNIPTGTKVVIRGATDPLYNGVFVISNVAPGDYEYTMNGTPAASPAVGTITASGVHIEGLTDASGNIQDQRTITNNQPLKGVARKSTASPRFKSFPLSAICDNANGVTISIQMIIDE